jgi:hypothetical protein
MASELNSNHILAAALALVEKRLEEALSELSRKDETTPDKVVELVESVVSKKFTNLPDFGELTDQVYRRVSEDSKAQEAKFKTQLDSVVESLDAKITANGAASTHTILQEFVRPSLDEQYTRKSSFDSHNHDSDYVGKDEFNQNKVATKSLVATLAKSVQDELGDTQAAMDAHKAEHAQKLSDLSDDLNTQTESIRRNVKAIDDRALEHADLTQKAISGLGDAHVSLKNELKLHKENQKSVADKFKDSLKTLDSKKANVNHTHDYAPVNHSHEEYLTPDHMAAINSHISDLDSNTHKRIDDLVGNLSNKLDKNEAITHEDLASFKADVLRHAQENVRVPQDGLNWEFKQHPQRQGTILYKREDDRTWRQMVLFNENLMKEMMGAVNKALASREAPVNTPFGMAGPAYQDPREIVSQGSLNDLMDVDTKTVKPSTNDVFMWDSISNQWVPRTMQDMAALIIPILENDLNKQYNKLVDQIDPNTMYIGESVPGTATTAAGWRIKKVSEDINGDMTILWAQSTADFIHVWDNRATYTYSI